MKGKILTGILILMVVSPNTSYPCPNIPPSVIITAPSDGALFTEGDDITIEAHAWDDDGQVTKVEFYVGTTKIGEDTSEPYSYVWTNVSTGSYTLKARAYDNGGAWSDFDSVNIIVGVIRYVDKDANGVGDGQSWEDAYNYLQDALTVAAASDEIRVAEGVYRPDEDADHPDGTDDRTATFRLINGVAIEGGYAGFGESNPDARDMAAYETVLSGDIGSEGSDSDNSYHVVTADDPDIDNSTVLDGFTITGGNNANGGTVRYGGGLLVLGQEGSEPEPTVVNCVFRNNKAYYGGGGICCSFASPTITKCFFSNNSASSTACSGGGLRNFASDPKVINCIFSGNTAEYGGGMENINSSPTVVNCVFSKNTATQKGGGMDNYADPSYSGEPESNPSITNCIFWGNQAQVSGDQINNHWALDGSVNPTITYCDIQGGYVGEGNIDVDPRFVHAGNPTGADNVFGTLDDGLYLRPDSPYNCIDKGHERDVDYPDVPDDDITGYARPADGDHSGLAGVDMGAYETVPVWYVKADAEGNNDGTNWTDARNYLQDALVYDAAEGDEIWVAEGTYRPDQGGGKILSDRTATFDLRDGVSIYGGFAGTEHSRAWRDWTVNQTILSADIGTPDNQNDNSYHVVKGADNAVLDGFTITGGNANGMYPTPESWGGGMYNDRSSPIVTHCMISGNFANAGGGGMYNQWNSSPTVTNCIFHGNSTSHVGGGMHNNGYDGFNAPIVTNCTFSGNSAAFGGGMYNSQSFSRLTNCTFIGNNAGNQGGGICNNGSYPEIINCIIWGNTAASEASIYNINSYNLDDDPSLVAWWRFDEGEGSIAYDSAGDNNGTIYGAQWTTGQIDGALDFDGVDDYVETTVLNNIAEPITISAWIRTRELDQTQTIFGRNRYIGCYQYQNWLTILYDNRVMFGDRPGPGSDLYVFSTYPIEKDKWYHIAVTRVSSSDIKLYMNGVLNNSGSTNFHDNSGINYRIGTINTGHYPFEGTIDDVRIYSRSLTEGEVGSLSGFIRYSNIEGCGGSGEWDASFGTDGGGNIDEGPCFADPDNPAGTDGVFGTSDDGLRLKLVSPCIDAADGDAAPDTDICEDRRADMDFIVNAGVGNPDYADIGAYEYHDSPEYITSFEQYQGYDVYSSIDGVDGWQVESGSATVKTAQYKYGAETTDYHGYQRVQVSSGSTISYSTADARQKSFVRISCIPSSGSFINVMDGSSKVASIKFETDGTISIWNNGSYTTTSHVYNSVADLCRNFLNNPGTYYTHDKYSYENTWIEFVIEFDWENYTYDVSWDHWDVEEPTSIYTTGAGFDSSHNSYTEVEFIAGTESFELNRMSISDIATPGGVVGPDEDDDAWLIAPVADILNPLKGQCIVGGPMWYDTLGEYVVKCCPSDLDSADPDNWITVCSGRTISQDPIFLGFWNTEAFYNGDYFLKIEIYDDLRRLYSEGIIEVERTFNGEPKTCKVKYPVIGRAKARTFHYEERPDFTINWPGTFPFEFKRIYNNGLRARIYPLFFGWTHNHNIRLIEDCEYDWIMDEFENEKPARDGSGLGVGRLWLCQPLGGEMFIGYVDGAEVIYEPLNNENHYIIRTSSVDNSEPDNPVFTVDYVYHAPDGMKMTFNKVFTGPRSIPANEGLVDWIVVAGIDEQADRFGNALMYEWSGVDEQDIFLDKISAKVNDVVLPANLQFTYEFAPFGPEIGPQDLCSSITLYEDETATNANVVLGSLPPEFHAFSYFAYGATVGISPDIHYIVYSHAIEQEFMLTETYPSLWCDMMDIPIMISTYAKHDDDGTLIEKHENWSNLSGPPRSMYTTTPFEQYDYEYDNEGNLITTIKVMESGDCYWECEDVAVLIREEVAVTSPQGALLSKNIETFTQEFDPYDYGNFVKILNNPIHDIGYHAGGGGAIDTDYYYEDEDFPLKPTRIIEHFDDDGDGQYDRPSKKTTLKYDDDGRGNVEEMRVYVDDVNFVYTKYDYHQDYDFPTRETTWQDYCYEEGGTIIKPGARVEKQWFYSYDPDDAFDNDPRELTGDGSSGEYLVRERTLLGETGGDQWAETFYAYIYGGRGKIQEDSVGSITYYEYDDEYPDDRYGFLEKEWQGAFLEGGLPTGNPQKRYYYDELGRKALEADYLGAVRMNVYDALGRVVDARVYNDSIVMSRPDEEEPEQPAPFHPDSYDVYPDWDDYGDPPPHDVDDWWETRTLYSDYGPYNKPFKVTLPTGGKIEQWYVRGRYLYERAILDHPIQTNRVVYWRTADGRILWEVTDSDTVVYHIYDSMFRLLHKYSYFEYEYIPMQGSWKYVKHEEYQYDASGNKIYEKVYSVTRGVNGFEADSGVLEKSNSYEYDILGRLTKKVVDSTEGGLNQTTEYGYDAAGNRIYVIDPSGNVIFTDYDNANRKVCEYFAVEPVPGTGGIDFDATKAIAIVRKQVSYYKNNKIETVSSYDYYESTVLSHAEYTFDSRGRIETVTEQIDASQDAVTSYDYSDDGSLDVGGSSVYHTVITDAEGKETGIRLSYHGKSEKVTYPSGDYEEYIYYSRSLDDPLCKNNGLLETKAVWDGDTKEYITYEYDDYGKVTKKTYPDNGHLDYTYTSRLLGKYGKVAQITDYRNADDRPGAEEGSKFTFDYWYLFEKVKSYEDYEGYTVHYDYLRAYDRQSEVKVTDPYETVIYHVTNSYDLAGRLIDVHEPLLGNDDLIADLDYDNNGNRDILTYSLNGKEILDMSVSVDYNYNLDNLLTGYNTTSAGVTGPAFTLDDVVVDGLGRLVSAGETITEVDNVGIISYLLNNFNPDDYPYDMRSQLIKARIERTTAPTSVWEGDYTYRKDGNLDTRQETGMAQPATFDYDFQNPDDGDIMTGATGGETFTLGWDWNGNMTSTTLNSGLNFTYNWNNKLRKVEQGTTVVMSVKYDPLGNRIFKDSSASGQRKYIVDITGKLPVVLMELDSADNMDIMKKYIYADGQVLAQHDIDDDALPAKDDMYFYLHDRLGSVRQMVDTSGDVVRLYTYKPFGETLEAEEKTGAPSNAFMFAGQYFDSEIDEYYLRARQYDPHIARFTSRDPVKGKAFEPLTLHVYLYCLNDPVNRIDPDGEFAWLAARLFIGAVVGTLSSGAASDWDTRAMIVGGVSGMLSAVVPGRILGIVAGSFLGGSSSAYAEYRQHGSWQAAVMGFSSGFGGGMMIGGLMGGLGLLQDPGLMTFISSQLFGAGASSYLGTANDGAAEIIKYMEEHNQQLENLP